MNSDRRRSSIAAREGTSWLVVAWLLFAITTAGYTVLGAPFPRPWFLFVGVGGSLALLCVAILRSEPSKRRDAVALLLIVAVAAFVRTSVFLDVVYSGGDHYGLFSTAERTLAEGQLPTRGVYRPAPLYLAFLVVSNEAFGVDFPTVRFVTVAASATLPIALWAVATLATSDRDVGVVTGALAAVYPLGLRTGALVEAEFVVLVLSAIALACLVLYARRMKDRRPLVLLMGVALTMVFVHFLYALILFGILAGVVALRHVRGRVAIGPPIAGKQSVERIAAVVIGIWTMYYIVTSSYSGISVGFLVEATRFEPITDPLSIFLPSGGAVAVGTGIESGGSTTVLDTLGTYLPIAVLAAAAGVGGVVSLLDRRFATLVTIVVAVTLLTIVAAIGFGEEGPGNQLRFYYVLGMVLVVLAGVGIVGAARALAQVRPFGAYLLVIPVLLYAITAPATPLANNVDPRFGGTGFATTHSDYEQSQSIRETFDDRHLVVAEQVFVRGVFAFERGGEGPRAIVTLDSCANESRLWNGGDVSVCTDRP